MSDLSKLEIGRLEAENERLREALANAAQDLYDAADEYADDSITAAADRATNVLAVTQ